MELLSEKLLPEPKYALCLSRVEYHKALKKMNVPIEEWGEFVPQGSNACTQIFEFDNWPLFLVCLGSTKGQLAAQIYGLLVHEAVHVWQRYCERIGEHNPGLETEAYAIQRISQSLIYEYMQRRKRG